MTDEAFIEQELREWGDKVRSEMMQSIDRLKIGRTGSLKRSVNAFVKVNNLSFVFTQHGRFVDMGVGRGVPLGRKGTNAFEKSRQSSGRLNKYNRLPKKFYSKTAYGMLGQLHNQLLAGYGDKIIDGIKKDLTR